MSTVVKSPRAELDEWLVARRGFVDTARIAARGDSVAMTRLGCGMRIARVDDPRHEGRVDAINGLAVTIRWDNGWKEVVDDYRDLARVKGEKR